MLCSCSRVGGLRLRYLDLWMFSRLHCKASHFFRAIAGLSFLSVSKNGRKSDACFCMFLLFSTGEQDAMKRVIGARLRVASPEIMGSHHGLLEEHNGTTEHCNRLWVAHA
ncbi:hypothetical protein N431DRAFT_144779 [Stipitochalara longipes BDJ]|nr:hypothetical protein N431DRAFT_144779 [Stipitochalara longipes BDJ]